MAKKKQERRFGQLPMPSGHKSYRVNKLNWIGLNKRQTVNSGELSHEENMSTHEYPYMVPCEGRKEVTDAMLGNVTDEANFCPLGLWAHEDMLVTIYGSNYTRTIDGVKTTTYGIYAQIVMLDENGDIRLGYDEEGKKDYKAVFRALITKCADSTEYGQACKVARNVVLFNKYDNNLNAIAASYSKKIIVLPDKKTMDFDFYDYDALVDNYISTNDNATVPKNMAEAKEIGIIGTNGIYYRRTVYEVDKENEIEKFMYYRWNDKEYECLNAEISYDGSCFKMDDLTTYDPVVYYNDGYVKTEDEYAQIGTDYYERVNSQKPYEYRKVSGITVSSVSESVKGLYERVPYYTYTFEKTSDAVPVEGTVYWYKYGDAYVEDIFAQELGFESGKDYYIRTISSTTYKFELTGDETAVSGKTYFRQTDSTEGSEKYEIVTNLKQDVNGTEVDGYYTYDNDLSPSGEASSLYGKELYCDTYYFNTYDSMIYLFVEDKNDTESDVSSGEESTSTETSEKEKISNKKGSFKLSSICPFPDINYAVVHQSRLFGVGDDRIYVSGFNDYANWNYDTINESYANNAWTTTAQANTKAGGKFTGISVFDNHVCCFKSDFMHEIYNNQNPFRLVDIGAIGTIDNRSIREVNGWLIFVTEDGVKMYTGSTPREIGYELGIDRFAKAVAGSDNRYYYLSCEEYNGDKYFFVYDTQIGAWSEQSASDGVNTFLAVGIAKAEHGMYMLTDRGKLYRMDTGVYKCDIDVEYKKGEKDSNDAIVTNESKIETLKEQPIKWSFETDLSTGTTSSSGYRSVNMKHIRKIQFLAEIPETEKGAEFKVYILCDDEAFDPYKNKWQLAYTSLKEKTGMFPARIKPRKTAHYGYRLRFEGSGYVKIHEVEVYVRQGGELYESD